MDASRPTSDQPDPSSHGGHPYTPAEIALGYGTANDPRFPRPTSELAADMGEALDTLSRIVGENRAGPSGGTTGGWYAISQARALVDALVARITDLEAQVEASSVDELAAEARAVAAEAQVAALTAQLENEAAGVDVALQNARLLNIARDLEAQVAALTADNAVLRELPSRAEVAALTQERDEYAERLAWHRDERDAYLKGNLWVGRAADEQRRAEAAEAALATTRQALAELGEANWTGTPEVEEMSSWVRDIARRALAATDTTEPA